MTVPLGRLMAAGLALACMGPSIARAQSPTPPIPPPSSFERELADPRLLVRRIVVENAKSLPEAAVREVVAPYEGRRLSEGDLREVERKLTQLYLDRGFATSGVLLARRPGPEGEAVFAAVEGTVTQVRFLQPPRYASPGWLTSLLVPREDAPVRLDDLQERMTAIREAGIVERVNAEIRPLATLGASELVVSVEERRPWSLELRYDNHHSPVIGARRPSAWLTHRNPTGWGDRLEAHIAQTDGLDDYHVEYSAPLPRSPWRFGARYERSDSLAIDPPAFRALGITSASETRRGEVSYAWLSSASRTLSTSLAFERRASDSFLLGMPFSFLAGIPDGRTGVEVVRAAVELAGTGTEALLFARGQWSEGRSLRAIDAVPGAPDARFRSFALQAQYARLLSEAGAQFIGRIDAQYTGDTLLPLEKKPVGGASSVRGYRQNLLLRDRAAVGTLEVRWPLWKWEERVRVVGAAFLDGAYARDSRPLPDAIPRTLGSAGVGLIATLPLGVSLRIDAAYPNRRWLTPKVDAQDRGVHFQVIWNVAELLP